MPWCRTSGAAITSWRLRSRWAGGWRSRSTSWPWRSDQDRGRRFNLPRVGSTQQSPLDNAVAESFFATLECELLDRYPWPTRTGLRTAIFDFIEVFYNRQRRHSTLDYATPVNYEQQHPSAAPRGLTTVSTETGQLHALIEALAPPQALVDPP